MGKFSRLGNDLYSGRRSYDFIGRRVVFYVISAILVLGAGGLVVGKGLNFGIEFTGGTQFAVNLPADEVTQDNAEALRETVADAGFETGDPIVTTEGTSRLIVQVQELGQADTDALIEVIAEDRGVARRRRQHRHQRLRHRRQPGCRARPARPHRGPGVPVLRRALHLGLLAGVEDVGGGAGRPLPRHHPHRRHLRAVGIRGHPGRRHRLPGDPGLLALRHRGRLRQGAREHRQPPVAAYDVRRGRQPRGQPDARALGQHLARGAHPDRRDPLRQRGPAGVELAAGPRPGPVRRHGRRCLLLGLPRAALPGAPEVQRGRRQAGREARQGSRPRRGRPLRRGAGVRRGHADRRRHGRGRRDRRRGRRGRRGPASRPDRAHGAPCSPRGHGLRPCRAAGSRTGGAEQQHRVACSPRARPSRSARSRCS